MSSIRLAALALCLLVASPARAAAVSVGGNDYPDTVTLAGKTLKRVGAGLRQKWMFDVYTMGVYTESGACDAAGIVGRDEVKYFRIDMLRDVSADKMGSTIGGAFREHLPIGASAALQQQSETFQSYFRAECSKGSVLEFTYVPGTGTTMRQNGQVLGPVLDGVDFMHVLWDIYFGGKTCCKALKQQILSGCGK